MTYEELARTLGSKAAVGMGAVLSYIQDYCLEKGQPPLTSIVVGKRTGLPGKGFIAAPGDPEGAQKLAFDMSWPEISPFPHRIVSRLAALAYSPSRPKADAYTVPDIEVISCGRGPFQQIFRSMLLRAYKRCCALCDCRLEPMLVGAHIVPWSASQKQRLNPRNGILLCRLHDCLYEKGILRIAATGAVSIRTKTQWGRDLMSYAKEHTRRTLRVPAKVSLHPDPQLLEWRASLKS